MSHTTCRVVLQLLRSGRTWGGGSREGKGRDPLTRPSISSKEASETLDELHFALLKEPLLLLLLLGKAS